MMYSLPPGIVQATSYPLPVCSAAIGAQLPAGPATIGEPAAFNWGPVPVLMLSRKKLEAFSTKLVDPSVWTTRGGAVTAKFVQLLHSCPSLTRISSVSTDPNANW